MKKYIYVAAAMMMMGIGVSSCSNENDAIDSVEQNTKKQMTFTVSFATDADSRAVWNNRTPKFEVNDQIGLYSVSNTTAVPFEVTAVDAAGNATITGTANMASEYHLVFPYKSNTTYSSETDQITGFDDFNYTSGSQNIYPTKALHYAKATDGATSVTFKNLCAILYVGGPNANIEPDYGDCFYIKTVNRKNPVIHTTGEGCPKVTATADVENDVQLDGETKCYYYFPVAPGDASFKRSNGNVKNISVSAGKIYWLHVQDGE